MFVNSVLAESNSLYIGDLVFYIVTFIILMLLVKHFAWKPVTDMMKKRADKIANDIDNAARSRESAEKMAAKRQAELQSSRQEAAEIIVQPQKHLLHCCPPRPSPFAPRPITSTSILNRRSCPGSVCWIGWPQQGHKSPVLYILMILSSSTSVFSPRSRHG